MGRPPLKSKQRQLPVALPAEYRALLVKAAGEAGRSIAEEIRQRLERTFKEDDISGPWRDFLYTFDALALMVRHQTGYEWDKHPKAFQALQVAFTARLNRFRPIEPATEEPRFQPNPWVQSDEPAAIGTALEAIDFAHTVEHNLHNSTRLRDLVRGNQRQKESIATERIRKENAAIERRRAPKRSRREDENG